MRGLVGKWKSISMPMFASGHMVVDKTLHKGINRVDLKIIMMRDAA